MEEAEILELEQRLLRDPVRSSAEMIADLLCENFTEFCSSGAIYRYAPGDTFGAGRPLEWEIVDFKSFFKICYLLAPKIRSASIAFLQQTA